MITTTKGMMDEATLRRVDELKENENAFAAAVEYYDGDELVHRSVNVFLKPLSEADRKSLGV